jgi:hypothetical protein
MKYSENGINLAITTFENAGHSILLDYVGEPVVYEFYDYETGCDTHENIYCKHCGFSECWQCIVYNKHSILY